jgi:hypothetical protein
VKNFESARVEQEEARAVDKRLLIKKKWYN